MGRIRTIKPEFFTSRSLARCTIPARLTFAGLWTEADDHGVGRADPRLVKAAVWPLDDQVDAGTVSDHLDELDKTDHIDRYTVDGDPYYRIVNWDDHQAAAYRRGEPKYPGPDQADPEPAHGRVQESAGRTQPKRPPQDGENGHPDDELSTADEPDPVENTETAQEPAEPHLADVSHVRMQESASRTQKRAGTGTRNVERGTGGDTHAPAHEAHPNGTPRWDTDWPKVLRALKAGSNRPTPDDLPDRAKRAIHHAGGFRHLGQLDERSAKFTFRDAWREVGEPDDGREAS